MVQKSLIHVLSFGSSAFLLFFAVCVCVCVYNDVTDTARVTTRKYGWELKEDCGVKRVTSAGGAGHC